VNYCANIFALKSLGAERLISISACGSLREDYVPGDLVIPDQVFDLTRDRRRTFFGDGLVAHIGVADPFCPDLSEQLLRAVQATAANVHTGGTFLTVEGPRFSTKAESNIYRSWGMSLIGMTTSPEVFLAREAELCYAVMAHVTDYDVWHMEQEPVSVDAVSYAVMAHVTDYDVWHMEQEPVSVDAVIAVLNRNTQIAQQAITNLVKQLTPERSCDCGNALASALITRPNRIPAETRQKLDLLVRKYLK